jgi:hypothetical protein
MNKTIEIRNYSNPNKVVKNISKLFPKDNYTLKISGRKDKKYAVIGDFTDGEWVHFGQMGMEDYTYHNDEERRDKFRNRNWRWANRPQYTPAYLSYHVLW